MTSFLLTWTVYCRIVILASPTLIQHAYKIPIFQKLARSVSLLFNGPPNVQYAVIKLHFHSHLILLINSRNETSAFRHSCRRGLTGSVYHMYVEYVRALGQSCGQCRGLCGNTSVVFCNTATQANFPCLHLQSCFLSDPPHRHTIIIAVRDFQY